MVKYLVIGCAAAFLLQGLGAYEEMIEYFGLVPYLVLGKLHLWRIGTYLFLHAGFWHLFWNMFPLWMFGCELERYWGSREFLRFFLITGMGAGVLSILFQPFSLVPTIGASGAIYGVLMAYGIMFPERLVYLYFLFPVKVKYFVAVLGALTFFSAFSSPGSPIAHMAHLGGMVFAFLYLKGWLSVSGIRQAYYRWRLKRMRQRFKVYDSEERKREDDFW
ncbi:MAG: rhomboid family intramembrane serine protease, partial [Acidobacteriota bacterium]